jgi:predicted flap endonuclease-1-like 5' DNA nuclease
MNYPIEDIEGIGPVYGKKLSAVGITSTKILLDRCASAKGRKAVAGETGLDDGQLLKWANLADLMRISGIGKQFSELLEAAGVDTVKELRNRRADNLAAKMKEVNAAKKLTRSTPSEKQVSGWVDQAKSLPPLITH